MLKMKILLTILSIGFSVSCCANEEIYIGLGLGPENAIFKKNTVTSQPGNFAVIDKSILGGRGYFGSIFAGYAFDIGSFNSNLTCAYLALEANASMSSVQFKSFNLELDHSNFSNATYKLRDSYGISILPGFRLTDCSLLYGRIGYGFRNFSLNTTENVIPNINTYFPFIRYGIGLRQCFCDNFSIRVEYSWATYKKSNRLGYDPLSATSKFTTIAPKSNAIEIGLAYYF